MKPINFTEEELKNITTVLEAQPIANFADMKKLDKLLTQLEGNIELEDEQYEFLKKNLGAPKGISFKGDEKSRKVWLAVAEKLEL